MSTPAFKIKKVIRKKNGAIKTVKIAENAIQAHIIGFLNTCDYEGWRINSGVMWDRHGYLIRLAPAGHPDITGMLPCCGKWFGVEVKTQIGKQSDNQLMFEQKVLKNNGLYILARSVRDVQEAFQKHEATCLQAKPKKNPES